METVYVMFEEWLAERYPVLDDIVKSRRMRYAITPKLADEIKEYCKDAYAAGAASTPEAAGRDDEQWERLADRAAALLYAAKPQPLPIEDQTNWLRGKAAWLSTYDELNWGPAPPSAEQVGEASYGNGFMGGTDEGKGELIFHPSGEPAAVPEPKD